MQITRGIRLLLCALPQPGWGGTDLAGYVESVGLRPDVNGSDEECAKALDMLTQAGLAASIPETVGEDGATEPAKWELTPAGQQALESVADSETQQVGAVLLDLQPGSAITEAPAAITQEG